MKTLLLALALQAYFPLFNTSEVEFTGVALVNRSADTAQFVVRLNSVDGVETKTQTVTVPAGGERSVLLNLLLPGPGIGISGWVQVDSSTSEFSAYAIGHDGLSLSAMEPATTPVLTSLLQDVLVQKGLLELRETDTAISIVNPGTAAAEVRASLFGVNGIAQNDIPIEIPARGSRTVNVSSLLVRSAGQPRVEFNGSIVLGSNQPVVAWLRVETPLSHRVALGKSLEAQSATHRTAPFFVTGGGYQSTLNLLNPATTSSSLQVYAFDKDGLSLGEPAHVTLLPGGSFTSDVASLLRIVSVASYPGPIITGSLRIRESMNHSFSVLASVTITGLDKQDVQQSALQYSIPFAAQQEWNIPYVSKSEQYFTAYAIANPNEWLTVETSLVIEVYGANGELIQRTSDSLSPRTLRALVIAPPLPGSYIRITANLPIVVLGTIGTRDGNSIEAIAAIPLPE